MSYDKRRQQPQFGKKKRDQDWRAQRQQRNQRRDDLNKVRERELSGDFMFA